jgi:DNA replication factor GINS
LSADPAKAIRDADFVFENSVVKIVANRNSPEIELPGMKVGPFREGKEYEVKYWVATELKKAGVARIRMEEPLDVTMLNKIQWKERTQSSQKVLSVPDNFYPKLRRYLEELNDEAIKKPEKRPDLDKAKNNSLDIIRMRLKKIVSLASSGRNQTSQIRHGLTTEEQCLYDCLRKVISEWQNEILKTQGENST